MASLKPALDACRRCPLGACATQAVAGEGPHDARLMVVGEQPGDTEDLAGRPFVGPAGKVLDRAMLKAGLDRNAAYMTNAVKHFKFEPRGKRRLHKRPNAGEVRACKWWLNFEIEAVRPKLIVALGSTAAFALTGNGDNVQARLGQFENGIAGPPVLITYHPSYILRLDGQAAAASATRQLIADLGAAAAGLDGAGTDT